MIILKIRQMLELLCQGSFGFASQLPQLCSAASLCTNSLSDSGLQRVKFPDTEGKIKISKVAGEHLLISNTWLSSPISKGKAFGGPAICMWIDLHWAVPALRYENAFWFPRSDLGTFISPWHTEGAEQATSIPEFQRVISVPSPSSEGSATSAVANSQLKPRPREKSWVYFTPRHRTHKEGGKKFNQNKKREENSTLQGWV